MTKKELEAYIMHRFQKLCNDFPQGELIHDESPDFTVEGDIRIGIEIVEAFQDVTEEHTGSLLKGQENKHQKAGEALIAMIRRHTDRHFMINIQFSIHYDFAVNDIDELIKQCFVPCLEFIWNNEEGHTRLYSDGHRFPFPEQVDSIYIMMLKEDTVYCNGQAGWVSHLGIEHIQLLITKHENAMLKYKPCNEHWLLIREGNYYAGGFNDVKIDTPIQSTFDKVFLLRTRHDEILQLK